MTLVIENGEKIYPNEIEKKIKQNDANIKKVRVCLKNNKPFFEIFLKDINDSDIENVIINYNKTVNKKDKILDYSVTAINSVNLKD